MLTFQYPGIYLLLIHLLACLLCSPMSDLRERSVLQRPPISPTDRQEKPLIGEGRIDGGDQPDPYMC